jgi:hypothetical protein
MSFSAVSDFDAVDWVNTIAVWVVLIALTVFLIAATSLVVAKTRQLRGDRHSQQPVAVAVSNSNGAPNHRNASPVPPENPHAPPTPAYGNPRVKHPAANGGR